jgi:hypothetical protein
MLCRLIKGLMADISTTGLEDARIDASCWAHACGALALPALITHIRPKLINPKFTFLKSDTT